MIQNLSSLPQGGVRRARVAKGRFWLGLSGQLSRQAVRYTTDYPPCYRRGSAIMHPEVFNTGSVASRLEGSPHVISNPEYQIIAIGQVLFIQPQKLTSQSFGNRNVTRAQGLSVHSQDRDRISEQVNILPPQRDDFSESHSGIEGADQNTPELRICRGEQSDFFFPAESSGPRDFISHRDQSFAIVKRRASEPSHLDSLAQHTSQESHFPVDAGNLSLAALLFSFTLRGSFQPYCFVIFEVVESNALKAPVSKESVEGVQVVKRVLERAHSRYFAAIYVAWGYQVAFAKQLGKVFESPVSSRANRVTGQSGHEGLARTFLGGSDVSTSSPDRVALSVRSGVGRATVETDFAVDFALNDGEGSLAHFFYTLLVTFAEGLGPQDAISWPDKQQNGRKKCFIFREGQRDGRTTSGLWIRRSWVQIPVAARQFPSRLHFQLHNRIYLPLYRQRCA